MSTNENPTDASATMDHDNKADHWLVRPKTIRLMWWGGSFVLALTVVAQWFYPIKGYFGVDGWPAFGAIFGFVCCVAMVVMAKALGYILKRPIDYYSEDEQDNESLSERKQDGGAPHA